MDRGGKTTLEAALNRMSPWVLPGLGGSFMDSLDGTPALANKKLPGFNGWLALLARGSGCLPWLRFSMFGAGECIRRLPCVLPFSMFGVGESF